MGRFDVHGNIKMFACGTRTVLVALKDPKAVTKLVVESVMIFTLVKIRDSFMMGRLNSSSP